MTDTEAATVESAIDEGEADQDIARAVGARHSIARKLVLRLRRPHPEASPAEIIQMLEHQYATSITTAGAAVTAGTIAAEIGLALIPGGSVAETAGKQAAKQSAKVAAKAAMKQAAKGMAVTAATAGAKRGLVAGDHLALLDRSLLDRSLSEHEAERLVEVAAALGLDRTAADMWQAQYLGSLVKIAWADGVPSYMYAPASSPSKRHAGSLTGPSPTRSLDRSTAIRRRRSATRSRRCLGISSCSPCK